MDFRPEPAEFQTIAAYWRMGQAEMPTSLATWEVSTQPKVAAAIEAYQRGC